MLEKYANRATVLCLMLHTTTNNTFIFTLEEQYCHDTADSVNTNPTHTGHVTAAQVLAPTTPSDRQTD